MSGNRIDKEVAEIEFDRFVKEWDIDDDLAAMSMEDSAGFQAHKSRVVKEICAGNATIDEQGDVRYTLKYPKDGSSITELVFKVARGSKAVMDNYKEREAIHKTMAYIGSLTGQPPKVMFSLDPRDQKFGEAVAVLFLAS